VKPHPAIVVCMMLWAGLTAGGQDRTPDRVERLQQWIEAVEQHELGEADDSLQRVASWDRTTLWNVWIDSNAIVSLAREPNVLVFSTPVEPEPFSAIFRVPQEALRARLRMRVVPYGRENIRRLQRVAKDVIERGGEDRLLKRGALLHADIAMLGEGPAANPDPARRPRSGTIMLFHSDGQQTGVDDASVHWEMGRRLLDKVRPKTSRKLGPDPGADETVRLWYLAAAIYMQAQSQNDAWHVDRAVELFPKDPEVLFFAGCAREWFSGPQTQNALRSTTLARELFNLIGSESDELRRAEQLFRDSLEHDPERAEPRIRLGRVLGRRGRHQDAIVELRRATMGTKNRLLLYYGNMFLGAEADALNLADEAKQAYERAGDLYPGAQSPRLAISSMATRAGDRSGALSAIEDVLTGDEPLREDDPWWSYYTSQARDLEGILAKLRESIAREPQ
jgi:tetratricopeptide (TPR) repeat protein